MKTTIELLSVLLSMKREFNENFNVQISKIIKAMEANKINDTETKQLKKTLLDSKAEVEALKLQVAVLNLQLKSRNDILSTLLGEEKEIHILVQNHTILEQSMAEGQFEMAEANKKKPTAPVPTPTPAPAAQQSCGCPINIPDVLQKSKSYCVHMQKLRTAGKLIAMTSAGLIDDSSSDEE